jgi:hypothetical protein
MAQEDAMNGEDVCIVCDEESTDLICRACQRLIGAKMLEAEEPGPARDGAAMAGTLPA